MKRFQVIVGNIGKVYDGDNEVEAKKIYGQYKDEIKSGSAGRATGEEVTLMRDGDPWYTYTPVNEEEPKVFKIYSDEEKALIKEYPYIYSWHHGSSFPYYIKNLLYKAKETNAPKTAVYFNTTNNKWVTFDDLSSETKVDLQKRVDYENKSEQLESFSCPDEMLMDLVNLGPDKYIESRLKESDDPKSKWDALSVDDRIKYMKKDPSMRDPRSASFLNKMANLTYDNMTSMQKDAVAEFLRMNESSKDDEFGSEIFMSDVVKRMKPEQKKRAINLLKTIANNPRSGESESAKDVLKKLGESFEDEEYAANLDEIATSKIYQIVKQVNPEHKWSPMSSPEKFYFLMPFVHGVNKPSGIILRDLQTNYPEEIAKIKAVK